MASCLCTKSRYEAWSPITARQIRDNAVIRNNIPVNRSVEDTNSCSVNGKKVCLTPGCVRAASMLLENIDFDQDPCENFYRFTCGNFMKNTIIPDDKLGVTMFTQTSDMIKKQLRIVMEEPLIPDEPKPYRLVKYLYNACMNTSRIEEIGLTKILQILDDLGGWPVLKGSAWNESGYDWKDDIYKFRRYGYSVDIIIHFSIVPDIKNTTVRMLQLDQATLFLNSQFLVKGFDEKLVQAYYDYMVAIAVSLGADKTEAEIQLKESILFEIKLATIFLSREKRRNMTNLYNPMTISELQQRFPSIPWAEYITKLLPETVELKPDDVINIAVPSYISRLETILGITPNRVKANYLKWRVTAASILYLTESLRELRLDYLTVLSGVTQQTPRWLECVEITSLRLKVVVGSLYVQRFFKQESKEDVTVIVDGIRAEMNKILTEVTWMDEQTRQSALDKANAMKEFIGYPYELLIIKNLEEYYEKLELSPDKYLESILKVTKFEKDYELSQLRELINKSDWRLHAETSIVSAGYTPSLNYIEFLAGILQGVFYSNDRPMYLNFGAIGCAIAHEVTHALDDQGRQVDKDGNLIDWWDDETEKRYLEKAACIIQQYGNYTVEEVGLKVNGVATQGENIADNGGLKEANRAYNTWESKYGEEPQLPGFLNYSSHQMFWISAASIWCSKFRPEVLKLQINTDPHAPEEFRVIGSFSNRGEFANDFNCPIGSKMNPPQKCEVW